jgi:hypothetical protein
MVSNPDCAKFISDLINGTATAKNPAEFTDALKGFDMINGKGQHGFIYGDTIRKFYGFDGSTVHGTISSGKAQVELATPYAVNTGNAKWNLPVILFKLEGFNGFGYRTKHPDVLTPYLWSFTNHYTKGKFTSDGKFDPNAVSKQCGAAAILKALTLKEIVDVPL